MAEQLKSKLKSIAGRVDKFVSRNYARILPERSSLIIVLLHLLFRNEEEKRQDFTSLRQGMTVQQFRQLVRYFRDLKYVFVAPDDILRGLPSGGNFVLVTFDDGYYNNHLALSVLDEFQIPAVFFISTSYIKQGRSFWWDVLYRERRKQGRMADRIFEEAQSLTEQSHDHIERYLVENFGAQALDPMDDRDRPFTPMELQSFFMNSHVILGNHTRNHVRLTHLTRADARAEIEGAQRDIEEMCGVTPNTISYPSGAYTPASVEIAREAGLRLGLTTVRRKNFLPMRSDEYNLLVLNRYSISGNLDIAEQCRSCRSDIQLMTSMREMKKRGRS